MKKKKRTGILGAILSVLFGLLLTVSVTLLILLLFLHALNKNVYIPSIGPISGDRLAVFFDSWYPLVLGGSLVLIWVLILILINTQRVRRIFASIGTSMIAAALLCIVSGLFETRTLKRFPADWQDILVNTTVVFRDFSVICAMILIVIGAACLSVCGCITVVKGAANEKNS